MVVWFFQNTFGKGETVNEEWVTPVQAAAIIGCHILTVYRFSRKGLLRRIKESRQEKVLFSASDAEALKIKRTDAEIKTKPKKHRHTVTKIEAICPRCKKTHMSARIWSGKGRPYFFCPKCKAIEAYSASSQWQNTAAA